MKVSLPELPFDIPPERPQPIAPSRAAQRADRIDASLMDEEGLEYVDQVDDEGVPLGKRKDWVIPEPQM